MSLCDPGGIPSLTTASAAVEETLGFEERTAGHEVERTQQSRELSRKGPAEEVLLQADLAPIAAKPLGFSDLT